MNRTEHKTKSHENKCLVVNCKTETPVLAEPPHIQPAIRHFSQLSICWITIERFDQFEIALYVISLPNATSVSSFDKCLPLRLTVGSLTLNGNVRWFPGVTNKRI